MKTSCVKCFKTISTKNRFKIFDYLKRENTKQTVSNLVKLVSLRQPTVTFHLNQLSKAGLIKRYKEGRNVFCKAKKKCTDCPLYN